MPLAKLESEWRNEEHRSAQAEADQASFATYYYHCDQIGAPQELTDEAGRIVWAASYKVWGQTQQLQYLRTGTDDAAVFTHDQRPLALAAQGEVQSLALVEQPLRFQGQYFDGETGLHYNRFRYYDPVVGRFVHQEPIGFAGGSNFFEFAPNPIGWSDPLGLRAAWNTRLMRGMLKNKNKKAFCDRYVFQDDKAFPASDNANLCLMLKGRAPIGNDEKPINLHHISGKEPGSIFGMQQSIHQKISNNLHFLLINHLEMTKMRTSISTTLEKTTG